MNAPRSISSIPVCCPLALSWFGFAWCVSPCGATNATLMGEVSRSSASTICSSASATEPRNSAAKMTGFQGPLFHRTGASATGLTMDQGLCAPFGPEVPEDPRDEETVKSNERLELTFHIFHNLSHCIFTIIETDAISFHCNASASRGTHKCRTYMPRIDEKNAVVEDLWNLRHPVLQVHMEFGSVAISGIRLPGEIGEGTWAKSVWCLNISLLSACVWLWRLCACGCVSLMLRSWKFAGRETAQQQKTILNNCSPAPMHSTENVSGMVMALILATASTKKGQRTNSREKHQQWPRFHHGETCFNTARWSTAMGSAE